MADAPQDILSDGWARRPWAEARRLSDELRTTRARLAALEEERADLLRRDRRSGLLTLDAFREAAAAVLRGSQRRGDLVALVLVDIDGFRELNGRQGAAAGDQALATIGTLLREAARPGDVAGRTGADELALLLPGADGVTARSQAERLVADAETRGQLSLSAGYAVDGTGGGLDGLLRDAAEVLARARRAGGGRVGLPGRATAVATAAEPAHGAVSALALALTERHQGSGEHAQRVAALVRPVARRLGVTGDDLERVVAAALLHDVGNVAVPDAILTKPGPLSPEEWAVVRERPLVGERILRAVPGLGPAARIVRHATEHFDGSGYPDGLGGEHIPLGSRIVLVCDAYDAMTSERAYPPVLDHAGAIAELRTGAGTQFDPRVVDVVVAELAAGVPSAGAPARR